MAAGFLGGVNDTIGAFLTMQQQAARNQVAQQELELARQRGERDQQRLDLDRRNIESEIAKREDDATRARREEQQKTIIFSGNSLIGDARALGYFDVTNTEKPLRQKELFADLKVPEKRAEAERLIVGFANHERALGRYEEGNTESDDFVFTGLDPNALAQGKVVVVGRYKSTGEPGVSTVGGTNRPDDPIYSRDFTDAANDIGVYFRGSLLNRGSTMGSSSAYTRALIANETAGFDQKQATGSNPSVASGNNVLISKVLPAATQMLGREGGRAALAAISSSEDDPDEQRKVLLGIVDTLNRRGAEINVPAWLRGKNPDRDKNIIEPGRLEQTSNSPVMVADPRSEIGITFDFSGVAEEVPGGADALRSIDSRISRKTKEADAATGDKRIKLERELSELQATRTEQIKRINSTTFNSIESELSSLKADRAKAASNRRAPFDQKIGELESRRELYLQAGYITPSMQTEQYKQFQANVLAKLENLSPEDTMALVQEGRIEFSEADRAAMVVRAQEAGVTSNAQIKRLPYPEQIALRAIMYAWSDNPEEREAIRREMVNLSTTGILSMSQKDLDTSNRGWYTAFTDRQNLELNKAKFLYDQWNDQQIRLSKALETGENYRKEVRDVLTGFNQMVWYGKGPGGVEIDDDGYTDRLNLERVKGATRFYLPNLVLDTRNALNKGQGRRHLQALNALTSTALAAVAENGTGGFWNWVASLSRPSASGVVGAGTDFDLSRFRPEFDAQGNITGFYYTAENGRAAGRFFTAQQVQNGLDPELYEVVTSAIKLNEEARKREEN